MKPVEQSKLGDRGDCFSACVASVLELPLRTVPDYDNDPGTINTWFVRWQQWLALRGWRFVCNRHEEWPITTGYAIVSLQSPTRQRLHAVVVNNNEIVWDPHPEERDQGPIAREHWRVWYVLVPLDPVKRCTWPDDEQIAAARPEAITREDAVRYEGYSSMLAGWLAFDWMQEILSWFISRKATRKFKRYAANIAAQDWMRRRIKGLAKEPQ